MPHFLPQLLQQLCCLWAVRFVQREITCLRAVLWQPSRSEGTAWLWKAEPCAWRSRAHSGETSQVVSSVLLRAASSQWTQSVLLYTTVLFLLLTPPRVCDSSEEEQGAGCLASEGVPCLPCPLLLLSATRSSRLEKAVPLHSAPGFRRVLPALNLAHGF